MKFFKCRDNRNFHLLLVGLAVIDTLLIVDLIIEVSIVGVFMQKEPKWYILVLVYIFLFIYFFYLLYYHVYIQVYYHLPLHLSSNTRYHSNSCNFYGCGSYHRTLQVHVSILLGGVLYLNIQFSCPRTRTCFCSFKRGFVLTYLVFQTQDASQD